MVRQEKGLNFRGYECDCKMELLTKRQQQLVFLEVKDSESFPMMNQQELGQYHDHKNYLKSLC